MLMSPPDSCMFLNAGLEFPVKKQCWSLTADPPPYYDIAKKAVLLKRLELTFVINKLKY